MSELKMISPLLDHMQVEKESAGHNGRTCYTLRQTTTGERFILKRISVPASDSQVRALILSGAYADEAAVHAYYGRVAENIRVELEQGKKLAASGCYAGALGYQVEPKESGVGYDVYILYPLYISLSDYLSMSAITNLRAINLALDLCDAIAACREAGYLFGNIKPENIYLMPTGRFLLGDLGLVPLEDMKYACLPEDYIGVYSAPELSDITASPNATIDLYSLGMVLYRIYNGNHGPFEDENTGEAMADKLRMTGKPLPTPIYADYELAGIILKACAFKQEDRYQTPQEFKQAIALYMQRNEISDTLIVPPIVASAEPLAPEAAEEAPEDTPMRMTDADALDEDFRQSFSPDLSGAGTEADVDETVKVTPPVVAVPLVNVQAADAAQKDTEPAAEESEKATEPFTTEINLDDYKEDPDQIDLDELLSSVNEVVGKEPLPAGEEANPTELTMSVEAPKAAPSQEYVDGAQETPEEDAQEVPSSHKAGKIFLIIALLLAIAAVVYFLVTWYFVEASAVNVLSCNTEEMVIELVSDDKADCFAVTCTDSYGKAYPVSVEGNRYTFSELSENTTYTITVEAAGFHTLTSDSISTLTRTTPESTVITEFTASRGDDDGEVLLSFLHEGPTPSHWKLQYCEEGSDVTKDFDFDGNGFLVTGLEQNKTYVFTLSAAGDIYLSGTTQVTYEVLPIVEANDLQVTEVNGADLSLTWEPGENLPDEWHITCTAEGYEQEYTSKEASVTLKDLPDFSRDYTISVSARGMDKPETLLFPANPIILNNLTVTANSDGSVTLQWETPAGTPVDGWYVSYNTVGSYHTPYMPDAENRAVTGNTVILKNLIPDTEYEFSITTTAADAASRVFGETTATVRTAQATVFDGFGITPETPLTVESEYISLWIAPEGNNWTYLDLTNRTDQFKTTDQIAVCLQVLAVDSSTEEITLTYAVRDENGTVVNDVSRTMAWNDMWYSRRHASAIPLPAVGSQTSVPGKYTLEIYVNSQLLANAAFTVTE